MEKEAAMMKEKASMEISLHMLKQEKETTAASKEAAIFEEAAAAEHVKGDSLGELQELTLEDLLKRTRDYTILSHLNSRLNRNFKMLRLCSQSCMIKPRNPDSLSTRGKIQNTSHFRRKMRPNPLQVNATYPPPFPKCIFPKAAILTRDSLHVAATSSP